MYTHIYVHMYMHTHLKNVHIKISAWPVLRALALQNKTCPRTFFALF